MEKWIFDSPDQAGEAYRQFVKDCFQNNLLIKNKMVIGGKTINLKNITMPLLNVMAEFDHLVPNDTSKPLSDAVSSKDKTTLVFPTGHIGIFVGSKSQKEVCPQISAWLKPKSFLDLTGEEKPAQVGEEKPAQEGEEKPAQVGEEKPAQEVEEKPVQEGEEKPAQEVEEKLAQEGEEGPAQEGGENLHKKMLNKKRSVAHQGRKFARF